jgi:uncharacterized protein YbgA (DUF1722 family)/uncharacterized protein YbbK (DUF523 family)
MTGPSGGKAALRFAPAMTDRLRIGVSACLLGREVRFDGQHKRDAFLVDALGPFVELVLVCPEVEVGMSIPREPVRLVGTAKGPRMLGQRSGEDWTARMTAFSERRVGALARESLSGYVLKKDSPSCGLLRVKLYPSADRDAAPDRVGQGLYAAALVRAFPHLPVEEEGRLNDAHLRESFIERVFAYHRLQTLWAGRWTLRSLIAFHTASKMTLLSHDEPGYRRLGRMVALGKSLPRADLRSRYQADFMTALAKLATPGRHVNVMTHMLGHFSDQLEPLARQELLGVIEDYRRELVPLIAPLMLLRHYVRTLRVEYLLGQTYLDPHPKELMLRNHV